MNGEAEERSAPTFSRLAAELLFPFLLLPGDPFSFVIRHQFNPRLGNRLVASTDGNPFARIYQFTNPDSLGVEMEADEIRVRQ